MWIYKNKNYPNSLHGEVRTPFFTTYTLPWYDKRKRFKMDSIYFKKWTAEKYEAIEDLYSWNFIIIDTETNGKNLFGESLPFQFSWIKYRNWKEVERFTPFINIWPIPQLILDLTHMEQSNIDSGVDLDTWMYQILEFLKDEEIIFAHNAWFDIAILNNLFVETGIIDKDLLNSDILIRDSMQYFYAIYKHMFNYAITWSSMEFLTNHFFMIERDANRAHQADYDCELLYEVIKRMVSFVDNNKSIIGNKIVDEEKIEKYKNFISQNWKNLKVLNELHDLWTSVCDDYDEYITTKSEIDNMKTAVVDYLLANYGEEYMETYFWNFYVKKNVPFETVKKKYLDSYQKDSLTFVTPVGIIDFFVEVDKKEFTTDIFIKTEVEIIELLNEIVLRVSELSVLQQRINNRLSILKAHIDEYWYTRYGDLEVLREKNTTYMDRTPKVTKIIEDYNAGTINKKDDLLEYRDYNTNLTIQYEGEWLED